LGFKIVIFPGDAQRAVAKAMAEVLKILKKTGNDTTCQNKMLTFEERFDILRLPKFKALERKYLSLME
jgi:2-methylisocitrate lyase-like PEP mutase family enzyme